MKLFATLAIATSALDCWTGIGTSVADFDANKVSVTCLANEETCQITVRQRGGVVEQVIGSCKAADACKTNRAQNFWKGDQCKPEDIKDANGADMTSVCRQCTDTAAEQFAVTSYTTEAEWKTNLLA